MTTIYMTLTAWAIICVLLGFLVHYRARAISTGLMLQDLQRLYKLGMTREGHLQIAREELRLLRERRAKYGSQTFHAMVEHLQRAEASLDAIGTDIDEIARLGYYELITRETGIRPLVES